MKTWVLAALMTVATIPVASALESTTDCQVDETRRETRTEQRERIDPPVSPAAATAHTTTLATRDPNTRPEQQQRRRNGKRVPDAELIGPRGAL